MCHLLCQAFVEAHSERKLVKKWVTAKIKEIADHGVAGWVIKREHPVIQSSQDLAAQDENDAVADMPSTSRQPTPAADRPPQHTGDALPSFCLCKDDAVHVMSVKWQEFAEVVLQQLRPLVQRCPNTYEWCRSEARSRQESFRKEAWQHAGALWQSPGEQHGQQISTSTSLSPRRGSGPESWP